MRSAALVVTLACLGCSSAEPTPSGPCKTRSGVYLLHAVQHADGTCGRIADTLVDLGAPGPSTCVANAGSESADHCKVTNTVTCGNVKTTLVCNWSVDGNSASCIQTINDGNVGCLSTYDVSLTKQ